MNKKRDRYLSMGIVMGTIALLANTGYGIDVTPGDDLRSIVHGATSGETINLAPGTYTVTKQMNVSADITIKGAGKFKTFIYNTGGPEVFRIRSSNVTVRDLCIDATDCQMGIRIKPSSRNLTVTDVCIRNAISYGIVSSIGWPTHGLEVTGCTFNNNGFVQILMYNRNDDTRDHQTESVDKMTFEGNVFKGSLRLRDLISDSGNDEDQVGTSHNQSLIKDNDFLKGGKWQYGTSEGKGFVLTGNNFYGPGENAQTYRHTIHTEQWYDNSTFTGNFIENSTGIGGLHHLSDGDEEGDIGARNVNFINNIYSTGGKTLSNGIFGNNVRNCTWDGNDFTDVLVSNFKVIFWQGSGDNDYVNNVGLNGSVREN
ncbi:hypothetical protein [Pontiella agarivorans]|uniref:Right handed beta helix domain-containing protein n=1 Tax=Pontiella agarivorans TaxID=3038953 RepID=A0ABU5MY30_9BACT|nr:hypothetical protein [Pontiella agarivorans]MDZ8119125.1 hypothetical protein [Pontiella agarivorans]